MTDTLRWHIPGVSFEDGSRLDGDWTKVHHSDRWDWQYDTHELSFAIYQHDNQFWKLYRIRFVPDGTSDYAYDFGGQACRMALVRYNARARSPHSGKLFQAGEEEWVRTYEVDARIHDLVRAGPADARYGAPYGGRTAA